MKTLYIDCGMGAAGDMLTAALLEICPDRDRTLEAIKNFGIPGVWYIVKPSSKCGITGTNVQVLVNGVDEFDFMQGKYREEKVGPEEQPRDHGHRHGHGHHHSGLEEIENIVNSLNVSEKVRKDAMNVYGLIARAESHAHGVPVSRVHFHEVGSMDAVADVTAVCYLMDLIHPDRVVVSPVHVGAGKVRCAHGILPVPAPATAYILRDVPIYGGRIMGELCTPTGAALLKYFADEFGDMPVMKTRAIGYGMGKKDFERANCVRVFLGDSGPDKGYVYELSCNVDDMTAEEIAFRTEKIFRGGALEVYTVPIGMKKNRPGTLIKAMCREKDREKIAVLMLKYTSTIGVREIGTRRYTLDRKVETVKTPYGKIRRKVSRGYGIRREKAEFDDLRRIADEQGLSIEEVRAKLGNTVLPE